MPVDTCRDNAAILHLLRNQLRLREFLLQLLPLRAERLQGGDHMGEDLLEFRRPLHIFLIQHALLVAHDQEPLHVDPDAVERAELRFVRRLCRHSHQNIGRFPVVKRCTARGRRPGAATGISGTNCDKDLLRATSGLGSQNGRICNGRRIFICR